MWENVSDLAKDLITKLLHKNYKTRILAGEVLKHGWFKEYYL